MIIRKNVHGTQKTVLPRELNVDTVYLRSNIHQIEDKYGHKMWEYDVQEMSLEEYFKMSIPKNEDTANTAIAELCTMFAEYKAKTDAEIAALKEAKNL